MSEKTLVGLPFPDEIFTCEDAEKQYVVDLSAVDFSPMGLSGDDATSISTVFIYLRNTDLGLSIDVSRLSFEKKSDFLVKYITCGLADLYIESFADTILNILFDNSPDATNFVSMFSPDEQASFVKNNQSLLNDLRTYIASIPVMLISNLRNCNRKLPETIEETDEMPAFVECVHGLFQHKADGMDAYLLTLDLPNTPLVKQKLYRNLTPEKNYRFFSDFYYTVFGALYAVNPTDAEEKDIATISS